MDPHRKIGIQTQDFLNTSRTLLPHALSYWTYGRGAEAGLLIATQVRGLSQFQLSFSPPVCYTTHGKWRFVYTRVYEILQFVDVHVAPRSVNKQDDVIMQLLHLLAFWYMSPGKTHN